MAGWGARDEAVDDFDEYDPTPYGGGYDIALTFGRPLPPSDEICYSISSSSSSNLDYDRPQNSSASVTSAYGEKPQYGHSRPKPQPAYGFRPHEELEGGVDDYGDGRRRPQPTSGYGGGQERFGYGGSGEYGGGRPEREEQANYGSGYGHDLPANYRRDEGTGHGYGYSTKYQGSSEYGSGGGQGYHSGEYGSGAPSYERPVYGGHEETGRFDRPNRYDVNQGEVYGRPSYGNPAYQADQGEGYRRPSYGDDYDEEKKHHHKHHHRRQYDDE